MSNELTERELLTHRHLMLLKALSAAGVSCVTTDGDNWTITLPKCGNPCCASTATDVYADEYWQRKADGLVSFIKRPLRDRPDWMPDSEAFNMTYGQPSQLPAALTLGYEMSSAGISMSYYDARGGIANIPWHQPTAVEADLLGRLVGAMVRPSPAKVD